VLVEGGAVTIRDSVSAGNGFDGFLAFAKLSENSTLNVYQCISTNNVGDGLRTLNFGTGSVIARIANSSLSENANVGLDNNVLGGGPGSLTVVSLGNNFVEGNSLGDIAGTITTVLPH